MDKTESKLLMLVVTCFALGSVSGQDVDVSSGTATPAVAPPVDDSSVDYASIISFSSTRESGRPAVSIPAASMGRPGARSTVAKPSVEPAVIRVAEAFGSLRIDAPAAAVLSAAAAGSARADDSRPGPQRNTSTAVSRSALEASRSTSAVVDEAESPVIEELRRRADREMPSQGMRRSQHVGRWDIPEPWSPGAAETEWPDWVFEGTDLYIDEPPAYADIQPLPLFYVHPPIETKLKRKVKKLVRSKAFREVRRHVKRRWRKLFKDSPTMRFETYEEVLAQINHIGKGGDKVDQFNEEYMTNEARDHVFRREGRAGEADIPLFTWGPLTVTAEGEFRFDMGTAASGAEEVVVEKVQVGEKKPKPLFSGKDYKLNTSLKLSVNSDYTGGDNYLPFLSRYGVEVEVEWLSDILGREMVGAELDVQFDDDGDVAAFFNFVIKSR